MVNNSIKFYFKKEFIFVFIFGLILLNFLGKDIYWCYLLIPLFAFYIKSNVEIFDKYFILITLFSILYPICLYLNGISHEISGSVFFGYLFLPPIFYFFGNYFIKKYPHSSSIIFLSIYICILFSILPFASNIISVHENGFMTERNIRLLWSENNLDVKSATNIGSYFALNMTLLPILFIRKQSPYHGRLKIISFIIYSIGLFSILNMSNRTGVFISLVSLVAFLFISYKNFTSILFVILFLSSIILVYTLNIYDFRSWFEYSQIYDRISQTGIHENQSRLFIWLKSIDGLSKYPYGYTNYNIGAAYAHNLWLDVGRNGGIIPLMPLLIYCGAILISIFKVAAHREFDYYFKLFVVGFGIGFFMTFLLEPILEGMYLMFLVFCFYSGMVTGVLRYLKE